MLPYAGFADAIGKLINAILSVINRKRRANEISDAQANRNALSRDPAGWFRKLHKRTDKADDSDSTDA